MTTIENLNADVLEIIKGYLPATTLVWLNKTYYNTHNHLIKDMIDKQRFEDYIRAMVRENNTFVVKHIIRENIFRWAKLTRWRYKNVIYFDYIHFIFNYAIENNAHNCRDLINLIATELLGEKWHKKNGIRYIRNKWTN